MKHCYCLLLLSFCITAALQGQTLQNTIVRSAKESIMNTDKLTNKTVKAAMDAWQKADSAAWLSFFTADARLFDDGNPRDFMQFSRQAIGHERFTSIDKVENDGLDIYGRFHSDQWGDFKTYFKFHLNHEGKIDRLDIGQAG